MTSPISEKQSPVPNQPISFSNPEKSYFEIKKLWEEREASLKKVSPTLTHSTVLALNWDQLPQIPSPHKSPSVSRKSEKTSRDKAHFCSKKEKLVDSSGKQIVLTPHRKRSTSNSENPMDEIQHQNSEPPPKLRETAKSSKKKIRSLSINLFNNDHIHPAEPLFSPRTGHDRLEQTKQLFRDHIHNGLKPSNGLAPLKLREVKKVIGPFEKALLKIDLLHLKTLYNKLNDPSSLFVHIKQRLHWTIDQIKNYTVEGASKEEFETWKEGINATLISSSKSTSLQKLTQQIKDAVGTALTIYIDVCGGKKKYAPLAAFYQDSSPKLTKAILTKMKLSFEDRLQLLHREHSWMGEYQQLIDMDIVQAERCIATSEAMCYGDTEFRNSRNEVVKNILASTYGQGKEFKGTEKVFADLNNALVASGYSPHSPSDFTLTYKSLSNGAYGWARKLLMDTLPLPLGYKFIHSTNRQNIFRSFDEQRHEVTFLRNCELEEIISERKIGLLQTSWVLSVDPENTLLSGKLNFNINFADDVNEQKDLLLMHWLSSNWEDRVTTYIDEWLAKQKNSKSLRHPKVSI